MSARLRQLLVVNPNTSGLVTELLRTHVQSASPPDVQVHAVTARFGAPYIADEAGYAVATHATLDAWAAWLATSPTPADAVLIGCFGDPGLLALRESSPVPIAGLAEAAFAQAARHGRFAVVTGGERWKPMLARLAHSLGHAEALAGIHTVQPTGAELAADPPAALALLAQACRDCARAMGAEAVILGGAGLAGMAAQIQPKLDVHVIDSVLAGAQEVWQAAVPPGRTAPGFNHSWTGVAPELQALGRPA